MVTVWSLEVECQDLCATESVSYGYCKKHVTVVIWLVTCGGGDHHHLVNRLTEESIYQFTALINE